MLESLKTTRSNYSTAVVSRFTGYEIDREMSESHNTVYDEMVEVGRTVVDLRDQLPELKDRTKELEDAVELAEEDLETAKKTLDQLTLVQPGTMSRKTVLLKNLLKYAAYFFLAGLFIGCSVVFFAGLFSGKLQNKNDITQAYSYPVIGIIPRKKPYRFERAIRSLEGDPQTSRRSGLQAAAQSLLSVTDGKKTCLISSVPSEDVGDVIVAVDGKIPVCGNILEDAAAVKSLEGYDSVVLVEQRGLSRLDLIQSEITLAEALGKKILGFVLT